MPRQLGTINVLVHQFYLLIFISIEQTLKQRGFSMILRTPRKNLLFSFLSLCFSDAPKLECVMQQVIG